MAIAILIARLILAAVLVVAGVAKIVNRTRTKESLAGFGVRQVYLPLLSWLLPIAELITAIALSLSPSAPYGAFAALTLFLLFTAGIGYNLVLGRTPDCNCFGQLQPTPIGATTLLRNILLAAVAAIILWHEEESLGVLTLETKVAGLIAILLTIAGGALVQLVIELVWRQNQLSTRLRQLEEFLESDGFQQTAGQRTPQQRYLPIGAPAPPFNLPALDGEHVSLKELLPAGKPLILFFLSPDCSPCTALIPRIDLWVAELKDRFGFAVVSRGGLEANRPKFVKAKVKPVLIEDAPDVSSDFGATWTPAAILIQANGTIGSRVALGDQQIAALLDDLNEQRHKSSWFVEVDQKGQKGQKGQNGQAKSAKLSIGDLAPSLSLPDLNGGKVELEQFRGRSTLVLFWAPNCAYCQQMQEDLQEWERAREDDAPRLLVVSRGAAAEHADLKLESTVVLDRELHANRAFGADGTPSAILVDSEGRIASSLGSGAEDVFALVGFRRKKPANPS